MIEILDNAIDFYEEYQKDKRIIIVWGASDWGKIVAKERLFEITCFGDSDKKQDKLYDNPVYSIDELNEKYKGKNAYIINSIGTALIKEDSVYCSCCKLDMDIKLVNIHKNIAFLGRKKFVYKDKEYNLFSHLHNCGYLSSRMSERAVEVAIAREWLRDKENVVEVGAVTSYYFPGLVKEVVDPADFHINVTSHESLFDVDLANRNVLCLSTIEHIGTGQYGLTEQRNAKMAIEKILMESKSCLITMPFGENELVDQYLLENYQSENINVLQRGAFGNRWIPLSKNEFDFEKLKEHFLLIREIYSRRKLLGANSISIIIEK